MLISYNWLQKYVEEELPHAQKIAAMLTQSAYEIEEISSVSINGEIHKVFDIDVLPNRASDSLGHAGVARELSVLFGLTFKDIDPHPQTSEDIESNKFIKLLVGTDKCRRALKQLAVDVKVGESPDWLKDRLKSVGQKPINNVVDITNFVMFELGQPVHTFDYDKLAGDEPKNITIREAKDGEKITTLDGDTYDLETGMLVIADDEKALDIAGIKGGQVSGIDQSTTRVMLSVCSFDSTTIRQTSQKLGLRTDASKRFENDVPPAMSRRALDRLAELMVDVASASVAVDVCDVYPQPKKAYKAGVTPERVNSILGTNISKVEMVDILTRLGCEVELVIPRKNILEKAEGFIGKPYKYGASVLSDAPEKFDCSSFTSWLYVQGGVALPRMSADQFVYTEEVEKSNLEPGDLVFSNTKKDEGGEIYYESQEYMTGTEISDGVDHCGIYVGDGKIIHASRHNLDGEGGVEVEELAESDQFQNITKYGRVPDADQEHIVATIPAWRTDLRISADLIEEIARVYGYDNITAELQDAEAAEKQESNASLISQWLASRGFSEVKTYSLVDTGDIELTNPVAEDKAYLRTTLRGNLEAVLEKNQPHLPVLEADSLHVFEIGQVFGGGQEVTQVALAIDTKEADSELAEVFADLSAELGIELEPEISGGIGTATVSDIESLNITGEVPAYTRDITDFHLPSSYPYVLRDIAVWTPAGTEAEAVKNIIQKSAGELLVATKLFDTYEKEEQISYAFKLVFQSDDRTLSDAEVNEHMQAVEETLESNDGFSVR